MDVKEAIQTRRAYRSLDPAETTDTILKELAEAARLSPSCMNKQPWHFVFIRDKDQLQKFLPALMLGNQVWNKNASLIIAVFSKPDDDCMIKERNYYLFDTGLATAFLILRATELGLVAHPMAGFDEDKAKEILGIPGDMRLITIIGVGKHSTEMNPELSDYQKKTESTRPPRKSISEFVSLDTYTQPLNL